MTSENDLGLDVPEVTVVVTSALSGEVVAEVRVASHAPVAQVKHEIEKATGKSTFGMRLVGEAGKFCLEDFAVVAEGEKIPSILQLNIIFVAGQEGLDERASAFALPFMAQDRDYLPEHGMQTALGGAFQTSGPHLRHLHSPAPVWVG